MAEVKTLSIGPDTEHLGNRVEVAFEVRTSKGRFTYRFVFDDRGSLAANEAYGREELGVLLKESLEALERQ
ncbi:MAG: hypothetical protein ACLPSW_32215 [Roseiarcus sp.]